MYQTAGDEFKARKAKLEKLITIDTQKCAEELAGLKLNRWFREKPIEVLYGLIVHYKVKSERLLVGKWTLTNVLHSQGGIMYVGGWGRSGLDHSNGNPRYSHEAIGVRFFRHQADLAS